MCIRSARNDRQLAPNAPSATEQASKQSIRLCFLSHWVQKSYQNVNAFNNIKETFILAIVNIGTTPANSVCDCKWHDHLPQLKLVTFLHYVPEERYSKKRWRLVTTHNSLLWRLSSWCFLKLVHARQHNLQEKPWWRFRDTKARCCLTGDSNNILIKSFVT